MDGPREPAGATDLGRLVDGRYRLSERIGVGGMATVHRALDTTSGRAVAIKLLRREVLEDQELAMRFRREALAATVLRHPNIVACIAAGTDRGQPYLVMELVEGEDLAARLRRSGRLLPSEAARIGLDVARALGVAHQRGIIHRDVKPGNIVLARDGRAMVTDFGIARLAADAEGSVPGTTLGSVHYFSPEQATGQATTPASDVYGLGLVLYEMLVGRRAWTGDTTAQIAAARVGSAAPSPRSVRPEIAPSMDAVVVRALQPDPEARYPNGAALAAAIEPLVSRSDPASQTVPPAPVAVGGRASPSPAAASIAPLGPSPTRPAVPRLPRREVRSASPAIAGPLVVLLIVVSVVGAALLIAALPGPGGQGAFAFATATPSGSHAPIASASNKLAAVTAAPTAAATKKPTRKPTPAPTRKPATTPVDDVCSPFFGFACGLDPGLYQPSVFLPAIKFTLADGWAVATIDPDQMTLQRDTGALSMFSAVDHVYPRGDAGPTPTTARGLVEAFIGTNGVAADPPVEGHLGKRPIVTVDLTPIGRDRIAVFGAGGRIFYLEPHATTRIVAVDGRDGLVVITIEPARDAALESILPAAAAVVKSVRFPKT